MSSKQIKIEDYFNIMRDDNGRVFIQVLRAEKVRWEKNEFD